MSHPTAAEAAAAIAESDRTAAAVRAGASRFATWLVGMSAATVLYFIGILVAGASVFGLVAMSVALAIVAAVLSVSLLPGALVAPRGFAKRWGIAVGIWGGLFGAALGIGLGLFPGAAWFWIPSAVVVAAPLVWEARAELRG